jgi:fumarate reductase flavoprotein subunit
MHSGDLDADVCVAGSGAAGLSAAIRCADARRSVLVLEANEAYLQNCNTAMSTAMIPAGGSRLQQKVGIDDSPQRFYDDVMNKTKGRANREVAVALTGIAPRLIEWLVDECGVELELVTDFSYPGHSAYRCHAVENRSGRTLVSALVRAREARGNVEMGVGFRMVDVRLDSEGAAWQVVAQDPGGETETIRCEALVLATNGFGADHKLVQRYIPEIAEGLYFGGPESKGDAVLLSERIGADTGYLDAYQGHGSVAHPHGILVTWAAVMHGAILVNGEGQRFGDETCGYSEFAAEVLRQPLQTAWVVLDHRIDGACRSFADYQSLLDTRALRWAQSSKQLAQVIGSDTATLTETLTVADACARGIQSDAFGRKFWQQPLEPPYGAVKVTGALFHTQGGLLVDRRARVLRAGEPLDGLYAAGGAAAGMSGHGADGYLAGNGLLAALGLGYLAGEDISQPLRT